ncbi:MAG: hypothetical protein ACLQO7_04590 [Candidatus Bathyarchaeia archaeon]
MGHSVDHVSLVLDEGTTFTGDLPPENSSPKGGGALRDWQHVRAMKAKRIYPAHGQSYELPART